MTPKQKITIYAVRRGQLHSLEVVPFGENNYSAVEASGGAAFLWGKRFPKGEFAETPLAAWQKFREFQSALIHDLTRQVLEAERNVEIADTEISKIQFPNAFKYRRQ